MVGKACKCLWCGKPFTSRRNKRLCPDCRAEQNTKDRERRDAENEELMDSLIPYLNGRELPGATAKQKIANVRAWAKRLNSPEGRSVVDGQPLAWDQHWGSDDGESTYFSAVSLAIEESKDVLREDAEAQEWYADNPHWVVGIPGTERLTERLPDGWMSCVGKRGTRAGYKRHKVDKTMACPECTEAQREYERERWHNRK